LTPHAIAPAAELVARHASAEARATPGSSLLTVLHAIQDDAGYIPDGVVAPLAKAMNLSRAEVHGVITFYHHFRTTPPPQVTVQVCRAESCRSMGSEALVAHIEQRTGCHVDAHRHAPADGATAAPHGSGAVGVESVYCLGLCAVSPAMMINGKLVARVTPAKFDAALDSALSAASQDGQPRAAKEFA